MKICIENENGQIKKDCDLIIKNHLNETVKYSKELRGETNYLKNLAKMSEKIGCAVISPFDTDNYGVQRRSCGVFENGKLLGISDMTVSYESSQFMPGNHGKIYYLNCGKIAVAVEDDLYRYELFKSFAVCGAEAVIIPKKKIKPEIDGIIIRAMSYLLGLPVLIFGNKKVLASNVKGELIEEKGGSYILQPLNEFTLKTTKIRFDK